MITQTPKNSEVEVTLIGTGGGYGESVVLKIGLDTWIIVDSCINPNTREPLALEYLIKIKADLSKVALVICTHWHNDHIKGLSKILVKCPNSEFCFSAVNDLDKFLLLCELDYAKTLQGTKSSTGEFAKCLQIINERGSYYVKAQSNLLIKSLDLKDIRFEIFALSPSPKVVKDFDGEISQLITEFGTRNTAIIHKSPNNKSVVLLLKFNENRVLLGADLEIGQSEHEGWRHIVKYSDAKDKHKSSLYKISHHGSQNGYISEIFDILVNDGSVLKLTPYKSSGLPTPEMLEVYSKHSEHIFLTSPTVVSKKAKKRDKSIEKIINRTVISISEVKFTHGVVRSRMDYISGENTWSTEVFEAGLKQ